MKILWLCYFDEDLLSAVTQIEMKRSLQKLGHEVQLVFARSKVSDNHAIGDIETWPKRNLFDKLIFQLRALWRALLGSEDIVLLDQEFLVHAILPSMLLNRVIRGRKRFVLDIRTLPVQNPTGLKERLRWRRFWSAVRMADKFADGMTAITPMLTKELQNRFKLVKTPIVWSSGVDVQRFKPMVRSGFRKKSKAIIYHGSIASNRGLHELITATSLLVGRAVPVSLTLLGSGPGIEELTELTHKLQITAHVRIVKPIPFAEVPAYLTRFDIAVVPLPPEVFWNTSSPIKVMEYLATGLPTVLSDIPAHRLIVDESRAAVLVEPSAEQLANGILEVLTNESLASELSQNARRLACMELSWQGQAKVLADYLESLTRESDSGIAT